MALLYVSIQMISPEIRLFAIAAVEISLSQVHLKTKVRNFKIFNPKSFKLNLPSYADSIYRYSRNPFGRRCTGIALSEAFYGTLNCRRYGKAYCKYHKATLGHCAWTVKKRNFLNHLGGCSDLFCR